MTRSIIIIFPAFFISPHIFIHNTCIKIKIVPSITYLFPAFYWFSVHIIILIPVTVTFPMSFSKQKIQIYICCNPRHFSQICTLPHDIISGIITHGIILCDPFLPIRKTRIRKFSCKPI